MAGRTRGGAPGLGTVVAPLGVALSFLLGFAVTAGPYLERALPSGYRHLTPAYLGAIGLGLAPLFVKSGFDRRFQYPVWLWAMAGVAAVSAVTIPIAWNGTDATADVARLAYVFCVLALSFVAGGDGRWRTWGAAGVILGGLLFVGGIAEWSVPDIIIPGRFEPLINRNLSGGVTFAGTFAAILLLMQFPRRGRMWRASVMIAALFFGYMVFMTASRGSLLSGGLAIGALAATSRNRRVRAGLVVAAVLLVGLVTMTYTDYDLVLRLDERGDLDRFSTGRTAIWRAVLDIVPQSEFLGVGTANLRLYMAADEQFLLSDYGRGGGTPGSAHSLYLKVLAENGVPGFLLLAGFTFGLLRYCWRLRKKTAAPLAAALFATSYLAFCDYSFPPWIVLGLSISGVPSLLASQSPLPPASVSRIRATREAE